MDWAGAASPDQPKPGRTQGDRPPTTQEPGAHTGSERGASCEREPVSLVLADPQSEAGHVERDKSKVDKNHGIQ